MQSTRSGTLIISDLHLGADISRAKEALTFLQSRKFKRLILLGDIFHDLNFRRLTKEHWKFLSHIRKLSNPRRKIEVVWVEGNHDHGLAELMSHLVGVPVYQQYAWEEAGKKNLAIHGHQFDRFVINNYFLSRLGEFLYLHIQKMDSKEKRFARYLDRLNTKWLRLTNKVADGALAYAKQVQAERIFCGHTHVAQAVKQDGIEYYNSGSWVDARCTFISVDAEGVKIDEYINNPAERTDDRSSGEEREDAIAASSRIPLPSGLRPDAVYESVYS
jgi:UDP-2,3-diacylglucosamine pyrophosphatase LpxH